MTGINGYHAPERPATLLLLPSGYVRRSPDRGIIMGFWLAMAFLAADPALSWPRLLTAAGCLTLACAAVMTSG